MATPPSLRRHLDPSTEATTRARAIKFRGRGSLRKAAANRQEIGRLNAPYPLSVCPPSRTNQADTRARHRSLRHHLNRHRRHRPGLLCSAIRQTTSTPRSSTDRKPRTTLNVHRTRPLDKDLARPGHSNVAPVLAHACPCRGEAGCAQRSPGNGAIQRGSSLDAGWQSMLPRAGSRPFARMPPESAAPVLNRNPTMSRNFNTGSSQRHDSGAPLVQKRDRQGRPGSAPGLGGRRQGWRCQVGL